MIIVNCVYITNLAAAKKLEVRKGCLQYRCRVAHDWADPECWLKCDLERSGLSKPELALSRTAGVVIHGELKIPFSYLRHRPFEPPDLVRMVMGVGRIDPKPILRRIGPAFRMGSRTAPVLISHEREELCRSGTRALKRFE